MVRFIRITLKDGTQTISKFERLNNLSQYIGRVLAGYGVFPVWRVVGSTHPLTGEAVTMRTVQYVPPREIVAMQEVAFTGAGDADAALDTPSDAQWQNAARPAGGAHGVWSVTADLSERLALLVGTVLVKHVGATTTGAEGEVIAPSTFVIVKQGDGSAASPTRVYDFTRHSLIENGVVVWTDERATAAAVASPAVNDDDDENDDAPASDESGTGEL